MPTRLLREGILTSVAVNQLSSGGEVFYRRLISVVDDFGRFDANPKILRAACYPLLVDRISLDDINLWLEEVSKSGEEHEPLISIYSVGKTRYLELAKFRQRLRKKHSKFPGPADNCQQLAATRGQLSAARRNSRTIVSSSRPETETNAETNAETDMKYTSVSATVSRSRKKRKQKISRAGKAADKPARLMADAAAQPPPVRASRKKALAKAAAASGNGHSPEQLENIRAAIRAELGPEATDAQIEEQFQQFIRRP